MIFFASPTNDQKASIRRTAFRAGCALFIAFALLCVYLSAQQARFIFFPEAEIRHTPADYGLKFEETWLTVEGEKLHGWWIPGASEKVLLYLHGNGLNVGAGVTRNPSIAPFWRGFFVKSRARSSKPQVPR